MRSSLTGLALALLGCSGAQVSGSSADGTGAPSDTTDGVGGSGGGDIPGGTAGRMNAERDDAAPGGGAVDATDRAPTDSGALRDAAMDTAPDRKWDWTGIVGTGQSLSVGQEGYNLALQAQPFKNLKLALNGASVALPPYDSNDPALSVVPLVEPIRPMAKAFPGPYPLNIYGETPHTAMADQISDLFQKATGGDYITVHTVVGESGMAIDVLGKAAMPIADRGHAYAATLFEIAALKRLAKAAGKTYGVGGVILTHGETDAANTNYESAVYKLYTDYNADIAAITGQTVKVPIFTSQQQTCPGDNSTTASLIAEWKLGVDHPGEVICVGPKYQYTYAYDHLHLLTVGYDQLGEKYAEVYYERVVLGHGWQPLQPISATRAGAVITVQFNVPVPPLTWDTRLPAPHQSAHTAWTAGKGFEVGNDAGEQTISTVNIRGDSVVITLASVPSSAGLVVRYAVTQDPNNNQGGLSGGLATGRIGQLRDSDPLIGYATKLPQYNFAVSFILPVN